MHWRKESGCLPLPSKGPRRVEAVSSGRKRSWASKTPPALLTSLPDTDECLRTPCQQRCKNSIGSYRCSCRPGFHLHGNRHSCVGKAAATLGQDDGQGRPRDLDRRRLGLLALCSPRGFEHWLTAWLFPGLTSSWTFPGHEPCSSCLFLFHSSASSYSPGSPLCSSIFLAAPLVNKARYVLLLSSLEGDLCLLCPLAEISRKGLACLA